MAMWGVQTKCHSRLEEILNCGKASERCHLEFKEGFERGGWPNGVLDLTFLWGESTWIISETVCSSVRFKNG